jgi:hypothetical protein
VSCACKRYGCRARWYWSVVSEFVLMCLAPVSATASEHGDDGDGFRFVCVSRL